MTPLFSGILVDAQSPGFAFGPGLSPGFGGHVFESNSHAALPHDRPVRLGHPLSVLIPLSQPLVAAADRATLFQRLQRATHTRFGAMRLEAQGLHGGPCAAPVGTAAVGEGEQYEATVGGGGGQMASLSAQFVHCLFMFNVL